MQSAISMNCSISNIKLIKLIEICTYCTKNQRNPRCISKQGINTGHGIWIAEVTCPLS